MTDPKTIILVVDDDEMTRDIAEKVINRNFPGFQVETREDGKKGLEFFEQYAHRIALVLTDFQMPNMNGLELVKALREKDKEVGIILASGDNNSELYTSNANFFLHKPYEIRALVSAIESVLSLRDLV
jgi:DNA-binding NtrC family response regulator